MDRLKNASVNSQVLADVCVQLHRMFVSTGGTPAINLDYEGPECRPGDLVPTITIGLRFATCMTSTGETAST